MRGHVEINVPRLESSIRRHEQARESRREQVTSWDESCGHGEEFQNRSGMLELFQNKQRHAIQFL